MGARMPTVLFWIASLSLTSLPATPVREARAASGPLLTRETRANQPDYASVIERLRRDMPKLLADNHVPGASVALVDDQAVIWAGGFGFTDRSGKRRITADTRFSLQSSFQDLHRHCVLEGHGSGTIHARRATQEGGARVQRPLPVGYGEVDEITFRHLLSHWAGLCHEAPVGNNFGDWHCTFDEHVRSISDTWLKCRVGERFRYSNLGYDLVGYALQLRAGKPFPRLMREELLEPLGMTASTFDQAEALADSHRARGHIQEQEVPPLEMPMLAAGGMYSTRATWRSSSRSTWRAGSPRADAFISADALKAMYTPQFPLPGQKAGYGLGVNSRPYHGATLLFHGGGGYGYSTDQRWVPEYKVGVVILSNGDGGDNFVAEPGRSDATGHDPRQAGGLASGRATPLDAGAGNHAQARRLAAVGGKLPGRGSVDRVPAGRRPAARRPRKAHRAPGCALADAVQSRPQSLRVPVR